jgi:hypothetical protein
MKQLKLKSLGYKSEDDSQKFLSDPWNFTLQRLLNEIGKWEPSTWSIPGLHVPCGTIYLLSSHFGACWSIFLQLDNDCHYYLLIKTPQIENIPQAVTFLPWSFLPGMINIIFPIHKAITLTLFSGDTRQIVVVWYFRFSTQEASGHRHFWSELITAGGSDAVKNALYNKAYEAIYSVAMAPEVPIFLLKHLWQSSLH